MQRKETTRCNRRPRDQTGRDMSVDASQTRLHHVHDQNFKPAAPTSGDKIINKRRFSPLVCVSLSAVKPDVGAFNRRRHMEVTNAGEWVRANGYRHNMEERTWGLQYWLRRCVAANRQKMAVKWCASWGRGRDCAGRGSQSLSNKRGATNMPGGRDRSQ